MLAYLVNHLEELRATEEALMDIFLVSAGKETDVLSDLAELREEMQVVENKIRMIMDI